MYKRLAFPGATRISQTPAFRSGLTSSAGMLVDVTSCFHSVDCHTYAP